MNIPSAKLFQHLSEGSAPKSNFLHGGFKLLGPEFNILNAQIFDPKNAQGLGRPGTLTTLYIDKDIRVVGGEVRTNGVPDSLFILVPQTSIP